MMGTRKRLDTILTERGLFASRSRAADAVNRAAVMVDGVLAKKAGQLVPADALLEIDDPAARYVSRGALKLLTALDAFGFDPAGRMALDIGASTGGFTQVLLERGVSEVWCVDVGRGQLNGNLKADLRVHVLEETDARALSAQLIAKPVTAIVADVSFISLAKALPAALALAVPGCWLIALVKPQFEAGRDAVGKGGIVRDEAARKQAIASVREWLEVQPGWNVQGVIESSVKGRDGNTEFLVGAIRGK